MCSLLQIDMAERSLAKEIKEKSVLVQSKDHHHQIYKVPMETVMYNNRQGIAKFSFGKPIQRYQGNEKVLMIVGPTDVGKTTLIEGMLNYIFGVKWEDDFRFKLANKDSHTEMISSYTIQPQEGSAVDFTLTIIDTPGFGDPHKDKVITQQIEEFFSIKGPHGIDHIDGIGFVVQANLPRLTITQNYICNSILSLFGRDVANNIYIMVTFADNHYPPVMDAIKQDKIPHTAFYTFNNSALLKSDPDKDLAKIFWQIGITSFEKFLVKLKHTKGVSLHLTKEVLKERQQLEYTIQNLQEKIDAGVSKLEELHQEKIILEKKEAEIMANRDFTYKVTISKSRKVNVRSGVYVTNCLTCNYTCHDNCCYSNDKDKHRCSAMDGGGENSAKCRVCPNKCFWRQHVNNPYYFEWYEETENRKLEDLEKKYHKAMEEKDRVKYMMKEIDRYLKEVEANIMDMINQIQKALAHLDGLALKPNPLTQIQHLDLLIESEKQQARAGYRQRIRFYEQAKQQAIIMEKAEYGLKDIRLHNASEGKHPWYAEFKRW